MKSNLLLFLAMLAFIQVNAQQITTSQDKRLTGLDSLLNLLLTNAKAAGFAVAVVENDKVIYAKGFGYRDYEKKLPVTPNTLFAIGSSTKAFTCALMSQLGQEGKVDFDKPALTYLPGYHFYNEKMDAGVTIRDMMTHRTGLPRHDWAWYGFKTNSRDSLMRRIQYLEPSTALRQRWQYNNFMYLAQAVIAEKVTGKTWEENIKEKIFTPLGMTRSNFSVFDMQKDSDFSYGYRVKNDSSIERMPFYEIGPMGPAGSINSSVTEIAAWLTTWINDGKYKGKEVLSPGYMQAAAQPQMVVSGAGLPRDHNDVFMLTYGLGWFISSYRGHYEVEHGGNIDGFSASVAFFPTDDIGVVVLSNQNGSAVPGTALNIIADKILQLPYRNWNGELKKQLEKAAAGAKAVKKKGNTDQIRGTRPSHDLSAYAGNYFNPGYGTIVVTQQGNRLQATIPHGSMSLSHYHYDVFEGRNIDKNGAVDTTAEGVRFTFRYNDTGQVAKLLLRLEDALKDPIEFAYQPKQIKLDRNALEKYTGEYSLGPATAKVYLKGDVLYVFVPGQPEYATAPVGDHTFTLTSLTGYRVHFETEGTTVKGVSFIQPNGTFKAEKKK